MKTCRGEESRCACLAPRSFGQNAHHRRSTGYSPTTWYTAFILPPFDILEATYLAPAAKTSECLRRPFALRARQLAKRPDDLELMRSSLPPRYRSPEVFREESSLQNRRFDFQPGALASFGTLASRKLLTERRSLVILDHGRHS